MGTILEITFSKLFFLFRDTLFSVMVFDGIGLGNIWFSLYLALDYRINTIIVTMPFDFAV